MILPLRVAAEALGLGNAMNVDEAAVGAERFCTLAHKLEAVVVDRVVARGNHDAAAELQVKGGKINMFGAAQAEIEDVNAAIGKPLTKCREQ